MATVATPVAPAAVMLSRPLGRLAGIGLIIFLANAALLVLQLVAGRLLAPFVGSSLETWTSIIGVFLTGIALGNAYGGRLADRYPTPRTLALLLAVGAAAALWMAAFPYLLSLSGLHKAVPLGPRIPLLAVLLCLPPGFVLSLLTPLAIKLGLPDLSRTGRVAGLVFSLSTLGCLIGNYLTGFVLIPNFTINTLVFASAGALAVLAVGTLLLLGRPEERTEEAAAPATHAPSGPGADASTSPAAGPAADATPATNPYAFGDIRLAYLIVFLASFGGMALEMTGFRVLAEFLGVSLFTATGVIGVMLAGTAMGNLVGGQIADRVNRPDANRNPRSVLACTLMAAGGGVVLLFVIKAILLNHGAFDGGSSILLVVGSAFALFVVPMYVVNRPDSNRKRRSVWAQVLLVAGGGAVVLCVITVILQNRDAFEEPDPILQVVSWTFSLFFLPMYVLGMVSPQVIRLAVPDVAHVGRVAGRVYAWSTAGAIVGTFATGYVLLSTLGMNQTLLAVAGLLTLSSLLVAKVWESNLMLYSFSIVLGGVTGGLILTNRPPRDEYLVAQIETNYYTIKVREDPRNPNIRSLNLDALLHSSVDLADPRFLHYEHEHVQVEFLRGFAAENPEPRVLVIGGGGYTFPRCALEVLPQTRMDVVEIDPGVTFAAKEYLGLKDYPGLRIVHMDGRQFVAERVPPGTYDLIIQDAVNDLSVPTHLLTKEYNDAVKAALKPNGVYLLTVIDAIDYGKLWKAAIHTLRRSYPADHVALLAPARLDVRQRQVYVIYASERPLDLTRLRSAVEEQLRDARPGAGAGALSIAGAALVMPGGAAHGLATAAAAPSVFDRAVRFRTVQIDPAVIQPYLDTPPRIVLTDQFAPVDNLMADVFRYRHRRQPQDNTE